MYNDTMQTAYVGSLVTILILHDFGKIKSFLPVNSNVSNANESIASDDYI